MCLRLLLSHPPGFFTLCLHCKVLQCFCLGVSWEELSLLCFWLLGSYSMHRHSVRSGLSQSSGCKGHLWPKSIIIYLKV